jgi:uncharacterized protein DUF1996
VEVAEPVRRSPACPRTAIAAVLAVELALVAVSAALGAWSDAGPPPAYVDIRVVPARPVAAPAGSYSWSCGRNAEGHRNSANVVVGPGSTGHVHHLHDYVGNRAVDARTVLDRLPGGPTTCGNGDASTYFWPVLRLDGGRGAVQTPAAVTLTYHAATAQPVVAPPPLLRGTVGDAFAVTNGGARAVATWSCAGTPERRTTRYPVCPAGDRVTRTYDFPSCWDGRRLDSPNHRAHLGFPGPDRLCPHGTFAVPALRVTVAYALPPDARYAIDAFPGQRNDPSTDHAFFVNAAPAPVLAEVVRCLNARRDCGSAV